MKNITLTLDEKIIEAGREYARRHHMNFNSLVRKLLEQTLTQKSDNWIEEYLSVIDKVKVRGGVRKWKRDELYRV